MTSHPLNTTPAIDVLSGRCPTARVETRLKLALLEEIDQARGSVARSEYLAMIIDAAMTQEEPHLPDPRAGEDLIDKMAARRYRQHVASVEINRAAQPAEGARVSLVAGRGLRSPDHRRPPSATAADHQPTRGESALRRPADGADPAPDPQETCTMSTHPSALFAERLARAERERDARLRLLWSLTAPQRVAAMRRSELTLEQLAAPTARHPEQVPRVNGEFEWITTHTPEACE